MIVARLRPEVEEGKRAKVGSRSCRAAEFRGQPSADGILNALHVIRVEVVVEMTRSDAEGDVDGSSLRESSRHDHQRHGSNQESQSALVHRRFLSSLMSCICSPLATSMDAEAATS